jgi:DNA-binding CsgD family transcriptional regulator
MDESEQNWVERRRAIINIIGPTIRAWGSRHELTATEESVVIDALAASGRDEIAARRHISPATLKNHVHTILSKTDFRALPLLLVAILLEHTGLPACNEQNGAATAFTPESRVMPRHSADSAEACRHRRP